MEKGFKSQFKGSEIDELLLKVKNNEVGGGGSGSADLMQNVTYEALVTLRNEGKLVAGQKYRMTDYETLINAEGATEAGHPFDLVLTALDNKTLDEKCSAIWSARDTDGYFAKSNLTAWDVRYSLDNDRGRFSWALKSGKTISVDYSELGLDVVSGSLNGTFEFEGTTLYRWDASLMGMLVYILTESDNPAVGSVPIVYIPAEGIGQQAGSVVGVSSSSANGKGVIYRIIDEYNNDLPYDFKNIMFTRKMHDGQYDETNGTDTFVYTFNVSYYEEDFQSNYDFSIVSAQCIRNTIKSASGLPNNVFLSKGFQIIGNILHEGCSNNTFGDGAAMNILSASCSNNVFDDSSYENFLGVGCRNNIFKDQCFNNKLGEGCYNNSFGSSCYHNTIGDECYDNEFGARCTNNVIGYKCFENKLGGYFEYNNVGAWFDNNTILKSCSYTTFKNRCKNNNIEATLRDCTFGNQCSNINIGNGCDFTYGVVFEDGVQYVSLSNSEPAYGTEPIENYRIFSVVGTSSSIVNISVNRRRKYATYVSTDQSGNVVQWTPADNK